MTDGHLLPEQLAEHAEGLLAAEDSRAADVHLRGCARCRETAAALDSVSSRLAAAPTSLPAPPDVVARVDRALAAEWEDGAHRVKAPSVGFLERLRARLPALAAAAAGVAVLGFAGWVVGTGSLGGNDADTESAAEAPLEADQHAGGDADAAPQDDAAAEEPAAEAERGTLSDGSDESTEELGGDDAPAPDAAAGQVDSSALEEQVLQIARRAESAEAADACGSRLAGEQEAGLVGSAPTEHAGSGKPDAVLVVLETDEPDVVRGWVLPSCDAGSGDALAHPLTVALD